MAADDGTASVLLEGSDPLVEFSPLSESLLYTLRQGVADLVEVEPNRLRISSFANIQLQTKSNFTKQMSNYNSKLEASHAR